MPLPRVGFRAFLLMITLALLIAATVAIQTRVGYRLSALEHASKAERSRVLGNWFGDRAKKLQDEIDGQPDSPTLTAWRMEMKANRDRHLELITEAEYHERLARSYER
jgi:hypothetical protein